MPSSPKAPAEQIDARLIRRLAGILNDTGLSEIEVEHQGLKIRVARTLSVAAPLAGAPPGEHAGAPPAPDGGPGGPAARAGGREAAKAPR
ncbi:MAG: acetyl-CoA carboxylase, biotin carboxyl carrier protein, partial [Phenylobacterium sp.]